MLYKLIKVVVSQDIWSTIRDNKVNFLASKSVLDLLNCQLSSDITLDDGAPFDRAHVPEIDGHNMWFFQNLIAKTLFQLLGDNLTPRARSGTEINNPGDVLKDVELLVNLQEFIGRTSAVALFFCFAVEDVSFVFCFFTHF